MVPVENAFSSIAYVNATDESGYEQEFTKDEVIRRIETGRDSFFVSSNDAAHLPLLPITHVAEVFIARTPFGKKYIKTRSDDTHEDNLLALPTCPRCDEYARSHAFTEGHDDEESGDTEHDSSSHDSDAPDA